jgi:hypothetical protein
MSNAADVIDALGGTTAVARKMEASVSTVHSWREAGIPRSRLAHLRLIGEREDPAVDVDAILARRSGHDASDTPGSALPSPGKSSDLTAPAVTA